MKIEKLQTAKKKQHKISLRKAIESLRKAMIKETLNRY